MLHEMPRGRDPFAGLKPPTEIPIDRDVDLKGDLPAGRDLRRRSSPSPGPSPAVDMAGRFAEVKVFPESGKLFIRVDHAVRDVLSNLYRDLGTFVLESLRPAAEMGFMQPTREPVRIDGMLASLLAARRTCEEMGADRADGSAPSLTARGTASEGAIVLDRVLIDLTAHTSGVTLRETELPGVLTTLTNLRHALGQLLQQFDVAMLDWVHQSGVLERILQGKTRREGE